MKKLVKIGILGALILYSSLYDVESIEERRSKRSNKSKEILPDPELIVISSEFQYMTKKSQGFVYKLDDNFFIISTASAILEDIEAHIPIEPKNIKILKTKCNNIKIKTEDC